MMKKRRNRSANLRNSEKSKFNLSSLINVSAISLILTLLTIFFYFLGVQYQTDFFRTYGVEVNTYLFSYESYFIAIGNQIIVILFAFGMLLFMIALCTVVATVKTPKSAVPLKRHLFNFFDKVKKLLSSVKAKFPTLFSSASPESSFIISSIKFLIHYIVLYSICIGAVFLLAWSVFRMIVSIMDLTSKNAQTAAVEQCNLKKAIQIELKPDIKGKLPVPESTYFFSYLGDKYIVIFSENTDCSKLGDGSTFFVFKRDEIAIISFPSKEPK